MDLLSILCLNKLKQEGGTKPTGNIDISSNGEYDVTDYATATVSVASQKPKLPNKVKFQYSQCTEMNWLVDVDLSEVLDGNSMFYYCEYLTSVPQFDASHMTNTGSLFNQCSVLETIPVLNFASTTWVSGMFTGCSSLTNDTLNNILASLTSMTSYSGTKTLKYIGLTSTQATTCSTLSNWEIAQSAGWSKGY